MPSSEVLALDGDAGSRRGPEPRSPRQRGDARIVSAAGPRSHCNRPVQAAPRSHAGRIRRVLTRASRGPHASGHPALLAADSLRDDNARIRATDTAGPGARGSCKPELPAITEGVIDVITAASPRHGTPSRSRRPGFVPRAGRPITRRGGSAPAARTRRFEDEG